MVELSHFDSEGNPTMVDVGAKPITHRVATASAKVVMEASTMQLILDRKVQKGDVLEIARIAGIMAAKRTAELIPLCHPLSLYSVNVDLKPISETVLGIRATASAHERTGVEMEALNSASVAALTVYDMCKGVDRSMVITDLQLEEKSGGKSGHFKRAE